jgi:feruloyl esterase
VEVWLPVDGWNGKFLATGNGGYAGVIVYAALADGLRRRYAVANTDMGAVPFSLNGSALTSFPERWKDWGFRATHEMTVAAKQVIKAYYGTEAQRSYFSGCSTGGQQGLMEAQRFPDDYDGIIAGAPGHNRTHLHTAFVWSYRAITLDGSIWPGSLFSSEALKLLNQSVLQACATKAGGLATDPFLNDPRDCDFDPATLLCHSPTAANCLSENQVKAARRLYDGPRSPENNRPIYPGWPRGSEIRENEVIYRGALLGLPIPRPLYDGLFKWLFPSPAYWKEFDFGGDMKTVDDKLAPILNAVNPDLRPFAERGGKLMLYHGWADAVVAAQDTINYYHSVVLVQGGLTPTALGKTQEFARLFLAPGMAHCGGGPGPNSIFAASNPGGPQADAERDALVALDTWVTTGVAPEKIIAVNGSMSRPLCPYPQRAQYGGSGDTNLAQNFTCADAGFGKSEPAAPEHAK